MPVTEGNRVVSYAGGGKTRIEERARPVPGQGELLVRVRCSGLCGTDLFKLTYDTVPPGVVLGHEIVGTICALGENAPSSPRGGGPVVKESRSLGGGFCVGDRVVVPHHVSCGSCALCLRGSETLCPVFRENLLEPGGFSQYVLVRPRAAAIAARKVPEHVSDESAVFLEPAACVLRGIWRSGLLQPENRREGGEWPASSLGCRGASRAPSRPCAVVLGAGSMGLLHLLVLRAVEPRVQVLVSDTREDRLDLARALGADAAMPPGHGAIGEAVRVATDGLGADAVFDTVGGAGLLDASLGMTREGGTVVLFAHAPAGDRARFDLNSFFKNERRVLGTYSGGVGEQEEIYRLIISGRLDASPLVTHRLPFEKFDEGVDLCRKIQALKVLFVPG